LGCFGVQLISVFVIFIVCTFFAMPASEFQETKMSRHGSVEPTNSQDNYENVEVAFSCRLERAHILSQLLSTLLFKKDLVRASARVCQK
jgi:hypothetical protein